VHQAGGDQTPKTASLLNPEPRTLVTFVKNQGQFGASLVCRYMPWHWNSFRIYQKRLQASDFFQSDSKDFLSGWHPATMIAAGCRSLPKKTASKINSIEIRF